MKGFASDNNSGVSPEILEAIEGANIQHTIGYGEDMYTAEAICHFRHLFGTDVDVYFVFNGTGANVLSIQSVCQSFHSVLCAETAHINVDECGAPEKITGSKIIAIPTSDGKLTPDLIKPFVHGFGFEHHSQPKLISISQTTEMGTVYSNTEIHILATFAHENKMLLHIDGARIANAVVSNQTTIKEMLTDSKVDIVSFGGTKNGMMFGEAVVFLNKNLSENTKYFRKQETQLYSKMRFIGSQYIAYFRNDLWLNNAKKANLMAQKLNESISNIEKIIITQKVQANAIFAILPHHIIKPLQAEFFFYIWNETTNEVRFMTSFDTTDEDIVRFTHHLKVLMQIL